MHNLSIAQSTLRAWIESLVAKATEWLLVKMRLLSSGSYLAVKDYAVIQLYILLGRRALA